MDFVIKSVAAMTLLLWAALAIVLRGRVFEFDAGGHGGGRNSFHALFAVYRRVYAGIFIFGTLLPLTVASAYRYAPFRLMLALSSVYALFMVLWTTWQYERYQHMRYRDCQSLADIWVTQGRSPYKGWEYAVTLTFGVMSPLLFASGLIGMILYG